MRQLMHHDHLDLSETHPGPVSAPQDELDDFAVVEVAADEFGVGFMFFEGGDGEMVRLHDGEALGGDGVEEGGGVGEVGLDVGWPGEGFDEGDERVRVGGGGVVEAEDVDWHCVVVGGGGWELRG